MDAKKIISMKTGLGRRQLLKLSLAVGSALAAGTGLRLFAAEQKGPEKKVLKEVESMIPGFPKVRIRESVYQPGASSKSTMKNPMVCECTLGTLEVGQDGKWFTANKGDIWTCKTGMVEENINKGDTSAIMRVIDLLPA